LRKPQGHGLDGAFEGFHEDAFVGVPVGDEPGLVATVGEDDGEAHVVEAVLDGEAGAGEGPQQEELVILSADAGGSAFERDDLGSGFDDGRLGSGTFGLLDVDPGEGLRLTVGALGIDGKGAVVPADRLFRLSPVQVLPAHLAVLVDVFAHGRKSTAARGVHPVGHHGEDPPPSSPGDRPMNLAIRPHFMGLLVIALVVFGIERLIVTDKEAIEAVGVDMATAIQERQFERLEALLHPDFEFGGRDRMESIAYVRGVVRKYQPIGTKVVFIDIQVQEDTGTADGVIQATVMGRPQQVRVKAVFARTEEDEWVLKRVSSDGLPR